MFANRVAMGRGLTSPRFRWVAFDDALIFPLNNDAAKRFNRDYAAFYPGEERLLKRYLADLKLADLPFGKGAHSDPFQSSPSLLPLFFSGPLK